MPRGARLAGIVAAGLLLCACSGGAEPTDTATTTGPTAQFLAPLYAGLPTRLLVSAGESVGSAAVDVTDSATKTTLAEARTDDSQRAWLSWVPDQSGSLDATVTVRSTDRTFESAMPLNEPIADPEPASTPDTRSDAVTGVFEGGGQQMWIDCQGQGGPTMVLIAGAWGWSKDWNALLPDLRAEGRVCVYDRPGLGSSPGRTGSLTVSAGDNADELLALLAAAGEQGPYLVVGHSYGGMIARAFNNRHPEHTAGMALLDPVPAYYYDHWTDAYRTLDEGSPRVTMDMVTSSAATGGFPPLTGLPLIVVSAGVGRTDQPPIAFSTWQQLQQETAAASDNSVFVVAAGATHQLQDTATSLSLAALTELRDANREHRPVHASGELKDAVP